MVKLYSVAAHPTSADKFILSGSTGVWELNLSADTDGDGTSEYQDCNPSDGAVHPGATEVCNGVDDDCNGETDEDLVVMVYTDADGDGFGSATDVGTAACSLSANQSLSQGDCDDSNPSIRPSAAETCNSTDDNCNGVTDEGVILQVFTDADGDGFGVGAGVPACTAGAGQATAPGDCSDTVASVFPGAVETCNGTDDNCNGAVDERLTTSIYFPDADGDGFGQNGAGQRLCAAPTGFVSVNGDCDDSNYDRRPTAIEVLNGMDDNCNGVVDEH
jgi:hypothetical protein